MIPLPTTTRPGVVVEVTGLEWGIREIMVTVAGPIAGRMAYIRPTMDAAIAIHEAGHVVMQFLLGARLLGASIIPWPGHSLGRASSVKLTPAMLEKPPLTDDQISSDYASLAGIELASLETIAQELLAEYWPLVRALAARLVERREIPARRARQILFRALRKDHRRTRTLAEADRRRQQETARILREAVGKFPSRLAVAANGFDSECIT